MRPQARAILSQLAGGEILSVLTCRGTTELRAYVAELRSNGFTIQGDRDRTKDGTGKPNRFKWYSLLTADRVKAQVYLMSVERSPNKRGR